MLGVLPPLAVVAVFGTAGLAAAASHSAPAASSSTSAATTATATASGSTSASATPTASPTDNGTLTAVSDSVAAGSTLTFNYGVGSASQVNSTNWIGIYTNPGCGPVNQVDDCGSKTFNYVTDASGTSSFDTTGWAPGNYIAYYLYDDGYTWLSQPVTFTITAGTDGAPTDDGTLTTTTTSVEQGAPLSFSYAVGESSAVNAENWVGIYSNPGCGPVDQQSVCASTIWNYTTGASGTTSFNTASLAPGDYIAYYLYDNGYQWLAKPVAFTVTKPAPVPAPKYKGTFAKGLTSPAGITVDPQGDVWATDSAADRVVEYSPKGKVLREFGKSGSGNGELDGPTAIALDASGDVYVADTGDNRVEEFSGTGKFLQALSTAAGVGFENPQGVAVDAKGDVWVGDTENNRVVEFSAKGVYTKAVTNSMNSPEGLSFDAAGDLWVANAGVYDAGGDQVVELSAAGSVLIQEGGSESTNLGGMSNPSDVALDSAGHVLVAEPDYSVVEEFDADGPYGNEFGAGQIQSALALAVAPDGDIFVADTGDGVIAEYAPAKAKKN